MTTRYTGPFAGRTDAAHVLAELPDMGGPEHADPRFIRAVERWDPRAGRGGMLLIGPTGSGKTTAAVHLVRRHLASLEVATSTMFCLASDLAADRDGILTDRAKRVALLVLDDLGKEDDPKRRIFQVLDHRHTRRPTVITSGLKLDDLDRHYADSATSRRIVEFRGKKVAFVSAFKSDQPLRVVGPGDQDEVGRRLGEKP